MFIKKEKRKKNSSITVHLEHSKPNSELFSLLPSEPHNGISIIDSPNKVNLAHAHTQKKKKNHSID